MTTFFMNNPMKLTIDGIAVEVEKGRTILEAAQAAGVKIPTLCHDRRLIPFGACRLCVVQQKGKSELLPSCFTPARDGMEIITQSSEITESRRLQLQFILLNHPMTCPWCEKEGECDLQSLVYEYGVNETIYPWEKINFPIDDHSALLQRDPNKCILCGRCVRICDEVQAVGELSFTQRGIKTSVDTDFHRPIDCEFCGQCLDTCPVGAITSDCFDYSTKVWELEEATTPCPYCGCGCLLTIGFKEGQIKRVFSDAEGGPNDGNLCVKGRFGWDFVDHPERLKTPLLRLNGELKEATWEEALRYVAEGLERIKGQHGPKSIGAKVSARLTNEEYVLIGKLFGEAIGTDRLSCGVKGGGLARGLQKTIGRGRSTATIREIRDADCILVIGVDPAQSHPVVKNEIHLAIRRNRARLIVLGSSDIGLSRATRLSPLLEPSMPLLCRPGEEVSILDGMIQTILREGLEDKDYIRDKTEGIEGLRKAEGEVKEEVQEAARAFSKAKRAMILIGSGPWSDPDEEKVAIAATDLALITGRVGRESSGILLLQERCNSQGAMDAGIFPGDMVVQGGLKGLYLVGSDPEIKDAGGLELLVVQDLFLTEAAKKAHVVLPACSFVEKEGSFTNLEGRVQRLHAIRSPLYQSRSDLSIFRSILENLEVEVSSLSEDKRRPEARPEASAKARLIPVEGRKISPPSGSYPFELLQRPSLVRSGLLSSKSYALPRVSEKPCLEMHPEDARLLGIEREEVIQVTTENGRSDKMRVEYSSNLTPGILTAPYPCSVVDDAGMSLVKVERLKK